MQDHLIIPFVSCGVAIGIGVLMQSIWLAREMKAHMARLFLRNVTDFIDAIVTKSGVELPQGLRGCIALEAMEQAERYGDHSGFYVFKTLVLWVVVALVCAAIYVGHTSGV